MPLSIDVLRAEFDAIQEQWNVAEEYVKKVERLRRGLVVGASINEFRYAGRRLVEAYAAIKLANTDEKKGDEALLLLREVRQFCIRAKHDAMDSAVTYVDQALAKIEDNIGRDILYDKFPQYMEMKEVIEGISSDMAKSRNDRNARDALYDGIKYSRIDTLIDHHLKLEKSTEIFKEIFKKRSQSDKREIISFWAIIATVILTIVLVVVGTIAIIPIIMPHDTTNTSSSSKVSDGKARHQESSE